MEPIIYDQIEQNSEEWHRVRLGLPTASTFSQLLAKGEGKSRRALMRRLAGEIITGEPGETFRSSSMDRGHEMESEARAFYSLMADNEPRLVGFVRNEIAGCSPDALIGEDGVLEIKTAKPEVLIEIMERDTFPPEHVAQTQGALWVTQRDWIDLIVFWPKFPPFIKRAKRDPAYIMTLKSEVARFTDELHELVERIRKYGEKT